MGSHSLRVSTVLFQTHLGLALLGRTMLCPHLAKRMQRP
jgi:hypothetical protein